ncbi:MFS transporter [bacterium]|nr:MFS transporter [bacterium]
MRAKTTLSHQETTKALRLFNWGAIIGTCAYNLWTGVFITGFALYLGAKSLEIGLLGAIPVLAGVVQPLASFWAEKSRLTRKFFTNIFYIFSILFWIPIIFLPFFKSLSYSLFLFFASYTLFNIFISLTNPPYVSWLGDIVPEDIRGRYFARRNMYAGLAGMVVSLSMGRLVDVLPKKIAFPLVFATAALFAIVEIIIIFLQPEPYREPQKDLSLIHELVLPLKDKNFKFYTFFISLWNFAVIMPGQFFSVFMLKYLHLSYTTIVLVSISSGIAGLLAQPFFGYLADRYSNKSILLLTSLLASLIPFFYIFMTPRFPTLSLILLYLVNIFAGALWAGIMLTQFNLLLMFSPPIKRMSYVGIHSALVSLTGAVSPFLGGLIVNALKGLHITFLALDLTNIKILFILSTVLRLLSLSLLRTIREYREEESPLELVRDIVPRKPIGTLRALRLLASGKEEEKIKAIKALAIPHSSLAIDNLINLLQDPNPEVRREAIIALGEIGNEKAIEALERYLETEKMFASEVLEALAKLGRRREITLKATYELDTLGAEKLPSLLQEEEDEEILAHISYYLAKSGEKSALSSLLSIREKFKSPLFKRQWIYSIGKLMGINLYPLLSLDLLTLYQRVESILRRVGKGKRRIRRGIMLALRHFGKGNYKKFAERLAKFSDLGKLSEEERVVANFFLEREDISPEEATLLALILMKAI